jgi:hypothetical protein
MDTSEPTQWSAADARSAAAALKTIADLSDQHPTLT